MAEHGKLIWDQTGSRFYETGVSNTALYVKEKQDGGGYAYSAGVAWSGVTGITESPSGAESSDLYADNIKYLSLTSAEKYDLTIEAYTYPDAWEKCNGVTEVAGVKVSQQARAVFGLAYITKIGNDEAGDDYGEKIHIVYNCKTAPSEISHATINDSPEAGTFSYSVSTTTEVIPDFTIGTGSAAKTVSIKPTSHVEISSTGFTTSTMKYYNQLKDVLFGKDDTSSEVLDGLTPSLPTIADVIKYCNGDYWVEPDNGGEDEENGVG